MNLRGYDPNKIVEPGEALAGFLRALSVANAEIPHGVEERAARFRTLVAGRRMLVVLDNARSADQVRPLLPGNASCVVIVTSRDVMPGLIGRDGAHRVDLDLLPLDKALSLLRTVTRVPEGQTEALQRLAVLCARLPLALRIAAERALENPDQPIVELVAELEDERGRLDVFTTDTGDPYAEVRAVFSWSCQHLDPEALRAFRLLGLYPGRDFDKYVVANLMDVALGQAQRTLAALSRAHLVEHGSKSGRYQFHDLLRVYAGELAVRDEPESSLMDALTRLLDYFLDRAATAMDLVIPYEHDRRPEVPAVDRPTATLAAAADGNDWLETERANLIVISAYAVSHGWFDHTAKLSTILYRYLDTKGYFEEAIALHTSAVTAARRLRDDLALSRALDNLGTARHRLGDYHDATAKLGEAVEAAQRANDRRVEGFARNDIGLTMMMLGQYQKAIDHIREAMVAFQETGDQTAQAQAANNLALVFTRVGRFDEAIDCVRQALEVFRATEDKPREGFAVSDLGMLYLKRGEYDEARTCEQDALAIAHECGDRGLEAMVFNCLGKVTGADGKLREAIEYHTSALEIAEEIGERYEQAQAHDYIGRCQMHLHEPEDARFRWEKALRLYEDLDASEISELRDLLAQASA